MAADAITTPVIVDSVPYEDKILFAINGYDTDFSAAIDVKATPGAGHSIYLTSVLLTSDDADAHPQLQDGDATVLFGPFFTTVEGVVINKVFNKPLKLTANKALAIKAAAAGNVSFFITGYTAKGQ